MGAGEPWLIQYAGLACAARGWRCRQRSKVQRDTCKKPRSASLFVKHHRLRQAISERIARLDLNPEVIGILRAITVADKAGIDHQLWFLFQQFGVNHLLVISGLHVGMIAGVGYLLGGFVQRLFFTTGFLSALHAGRPCSPFSLLYSALAGFSLPTQRALCMLSCFVIAALLGRRSGASRNLLMAAGTCSYSTH